MPFKIVESIAYDPKAPGPLGRGRPKVRGINPDLLMIVTRAGDMIKADARHGAPEAAAQVIMSPGSPGLYDEEFFKAVGPYADGFIYNLPWFNVKSQMTQGAGGLLQEDQPRSPLRSRRFQRRLHLRGPAGGGRRLQTRGLGRRRDADEGDQATNIKDHVMIGGPIVFNEKGDNP